MYRPVKTSGDTVEVPQLLFSRLATPGEDGRFKVALYLLANGGADAAGIAKALSMQPARVEAALNYWEGAGLIEKEAEPEAAAAPVKPAARKAMTTRETVQAGQADPTLGFLFGEIQRLFGGVVNESNLNLFATLYSRDGYPADLILMAASVAAEKGVHKAKYVESILKDWKGQGINDCQAADAHLKLMAERAGREAALARRMGLEGDPFTLAEKKKIAQWYEEYAFTDEMVEAARMAAGEHAGEVKYIAGILKKWYAKGYRNPRQVQQAEVGTNLRAVKAAPVKDDLLAGASQYVPMKRRKDP